MAAAILSLDMRTGNFEYYSAPSLLLPTFKDFLDLEPANNIAGINYDL